MEGGTLLDTVTVGIIGSTEERHCMYLSAELERQGAKPIILDNAPDRPFPLTLNREETKYEDRSLNEIQTYFLRTLFLPTPAFLDEQAAVRVETEGYSAYAAERERYATWLSFLQGISLAGKLLVNPVDTLLLHFAKPYQMDLLQRASIPVPSTLITGDSDAVLRFSAHRDVVYKPVAGGALCRMLKPEDKTPERLNQLQTAPVMFQEYIPGDDIRVFVLNGKVIAAFRMSADEVDFREAQTKPEPFRIDETMESICLRACERLGLLFSGVDLKLQQDGSVILIECNPSPMFEGFDQVASQTVVSQLADFLISSASQ